MIKVTNLKEKYSSISIINESTYLINWGKQPDVEYVYKTDENGEIVNDELGLPIIIETKDSEVLATWYEETFYHKPIIDEIIVAIKESNSKIDLNDIKIYADFLGENAEECIRNILMDEITAYDLSDEVNSLYLNGQQVWFDKTLRNSIERQIQARKNAGQATAPIAFGLNILQIPVDLGLQMLEQLEIYASDCYNATLTHKANIINMPVEEMIVYDYTIGYPEKLKFEL